MSAVDTKFYEKKKSRVIYIAIWFVVFILAVTTALFLYNNKIVESNTVLQDQISVIDNSIIEIESKPNIQTYRSYEKNKNILDQLSCRSQISMYVSHLKNNASKYLISAKWFNYVDGKLKTSLSANTDTNGSSYEKIVTFLREYPNNETSLFDVEAIESFEGFDRINFPGSFILNQNIYEACWE